MKITTSNKKKIIGYIKHRHLSDGGFFFAKVKPSAGRDTYLATLALTMLKTNFNKLAIFNFWDKKIKQDSFFEYSSMFWAISSFNFLQPETSPLKKEWEKHIRLLITNDLTFKNLLNNNKTKKKSATFNSDMLSIALTGKKLENLFYLLSLYHILKISFDTSEIIYFISNLQQKDGGFSEKIISDSATTLWAIKIFKLLNHPLPKKEKIIAYLKSQFLAFDDLENLFYVIESLALLKKYPLPNAKEALNFVLSCQRNNGGFSRSRTMGIPTIENTYQAIKILANYKLI